jgi:hypothetical protein
MEAESYFDNHVRYIEDFFNCVLSVRYESSLVDGEEYNHKLYCDNITFHHSTGARIKVATPGLCLASCWQPLNWGYIYNQKAVDEYALGAYIGFKLGFNLNNEWWPTDLLQNPYTPAVKSQIEAVCAR